MESVSSLDVSKNTALTTLNFGGNQISTIDLTHNTALLNLDCHENYLTALDLSHNTALQNLRCDSNRLKELDLSGNTQLVSVNAGSQNVTGSTITLTGSVYSINLADYVSSGNVAKISNIQAFDSNNSEIQGIISGNIVQFTAKPARISWSYDTGYSLSPMSVNIDLTHSGINTVEPLPVSADVIASGATSWNGHLYRMFDAAMTWDEAKAYCESLGGHLATITSQEEHDAVMSIISQDEAHIYWLGAHKPESSDSWAWVTGETFSFTKWHNGEPNNQGDIEQCLELTNYWADYSGQWGWNDENGDLVIDGITGFICEWEPVEAIFAPLNSEYMKYLENPSAYFDDSEFYGELPDPVNLSHLNNNPPIVSGFSSSFYTADTLPAKYDPRNSGKMPPVRDQGAYGTCWSFASLGAMEASYLAQNLGTSAPNLSELHQAWFAYKDPRPGYSFELVQQQRMSCHIVNYPSLKVLGFLLL